MVVIPRLLPAEKSMPAIPPKAAPKSVHTATRPMCRWRPPESLLRARVRVRG